MKYTLTTLLLIVGIIPLYVSPQSNIADTSRKQISPLNDTTIHEVVEIEANFPGGDQAWRRYLEKALLHFDPAEHGAPIGFYTVYVQFIVDKEGNISDVKALTNYGYNMEEEVVRIITKGPKWAPAIQNGRPVKAYRKQPISFVVESNDIQIAIEKKYVLYINKENIVSIKVEKLKNNDLELKLSQGIIQSVGNGMYSIKVNDPGKAILEIYNRKKKDKMIGSVYFEVKDRTK